MRCYACYQKWSRNRHCYYCYACYACHHHWSTPSVAAADVETRQSGLQGITAMPPDDTFVHILPFYTAGDLYHGLLQCRTSHSFVQIWVLTISYKFYLCSTGRGAKYEEKQKQCRSSQCSNGANNIHGTAILHAVYGWVSIFNIQFTQWQPCIQYPPACDIVELPHNMQVQYSCWAI